jgi:hypothetical protein
MNTPQTPATNTPSTSGSTPEPLPNPSGINTHSGLSETESQTMASWLRQDVASGKLSPDAAAKAFEEPGVPMEDRSDTRSPEQAQLDQHFPVAKPEEYVHTKNRELCNGNWSVKCSRISETSMSRSTRKRSRHTSISTDQRISPLCYMT